MRNIDLSSFIGKNLNELLKKGDQLFNDNLEGKIHAHKIYSELLEQVPNIYASTNEHAYRGVIRQKFGIAKDLSFGMKNIRHKQVKIKLLKKNFLTEKKMDFLLR